MLSQLSESYARCEMIARNSRSSFYRSFALLGRERRNAMIALYAFARLADDATDKDASHREPSSSIETCWVASDWHSWLEALDTVHESSSEPQTRSTDCLQSIRLALADSISRFSIPIETLHDLVRGVDTDWQKTAVPYSLEKLPRALPAIRMGSWDDTRTYCHRVASSVGIACLSIWAKNIGERPSPESMQSALDCGVAFQMTNILRDLAEDKERNRIYLPEDELARFGIDQERWLALRPNPTIFALNELGDWRGLIRLQIERTKALYRSGWRVADAISLDGQRMFSLMWHSYRRLLTTLDANPEVIWQSRSQLTQIAKLKLVGQHIFTPWFNRLLKSKRNFVADAKSVRLAWPSGGPRVAVVGAGLAGINASMHLARHGCRVTMLESKNRIGGRVGSFMDSETGQSVDYCQHVGMNCCSALKQWIEDTNQQPHWVEQDSLHFASAQGKRIRVTAWPLPAPFHLTGLLLHWPELKASERIRVGIALLRLMRLKREQLLTSQRAIDWLRANGQSDRCIQNFWSTILVSALGEQVERVTLEATHKVLVDGFAKHRTAFHLLVPSRPLSELLDKCVSERLKYFGVDIRLGEVVKGIVLQPSNLLQLRVQGKSDSVDSAYDAVVVALPWNKVSDILPGDVQTHFLPASELQSSPITGIHTWWDRPWLKEPHAILINRFSQWVFPAPESRWAGNSDSVSQNSAPNQTKEYYYQIVISGSRNLPEGNADKVLKMVKDDLAEVFPGSAVATLLRGRVVTDPNAVFSVSVGHESGRLDCNLIEKERIWLAGDWTSTKWPATMEGALRSGAIAAESLLTAFGHDACLSE